MEENKIICHVEAKRARPQNFPKDPERDEGERERESTREG